MKVLSRAGGGRRWDDLLAVGKPDLGGGSVRREARRSVRRL